MKKTALIRQLLAAMRSQLHQASEAARPILQQIFADLRPPHGGRLPGWSDDGYGDPKLRAPRSIVIQPARPDPYGLGPDEEGSPYRSGGSEHEHALVWWIEVLRRVADDGLDEDYHDELMEVRDYLLGQLDEVQERLVEED